MEWIEIASDSVDGAKSLALEKLGVHESEAQFEVIEEPSSKMFGFRKTQARVRARVMPVAPAPKRERPNRRRGKGGSNEGGGGKRRSGFGGGKDGSGGGRNRSGGQKSGQSGQRNRPNRNGGDDRAGGQRSKENESSGSSRGGQRRQSTRSNTPKPEKQESPVEEVETAVRDFLAGLADAFGVETEPVLDISEGVIEASLPSREGVLIGPKGRTLDAVQELTRVTAQRVAPSSTRIRVDVGGYRAARAEALGDFARKAAARARDDAAEVVLEPMASPDRKVVHDALIDEVGVSTRSVGQEPRRRVVIVPDASNDASDTEDVESSSSGAPADEEE